MSSLATRQPRPEEKEIIDEVLDLYVRIPKGTCLFYSFCNLFVSDTGKVLSYVALIHA